MNYVTDANISGLAKELRSKGIDCEKVHKLLPVLPSFVGVSRS